MLSFAAALVPLVIGTLLQRKISHGITVPLATLHRIATAPDSDRFDSDSAKTGMREADEVAQALIAEKRSRHEARASLERALEQRTAALGQRDLLLREVYHRVKNNLQLVDGLLALHMSQTANCEVVAELSDLRSRVYALGLVHQQLMTSADLESFDIAPFLHQLADNVLAAGGGADCVMRVEAVRLIVTLDFAIPLGLLVNELLTNCFKHSYPSGCSEISVRLVRNAVGDVLLTVSSTNQELPETARGPNTTGDFSYTQGQGVEIITGLVAQIDGVMQVCEGNPYTTEITIAAESFNGG
jgi:two-component sensor histidine kinase